MKSILFTFGILAASVASAAGGSWSQMQPQSAPNSGRTAAIGAPTGALQSFADQASFDAAVGDPTALASESFDGGLTPDGSVNTCDEPVNSESDDVCFAPGDLVPGFSITSSTATGIVVLGANFLGPNQSTPVIGANTFTDSTDIAFTPAVTAISADYYGGFNADEVTVEAFDGDGNSLGTATAQPPAADTSVFLGIISDTPIANITITAALDDGELLDNLRFGDVDTGPSDVIFADGFDPGATPEAPTVAKAFAPASVTTGSNSVLTITLDNANAGAATLSADLVDTFPAGLVVATPTDVATTCGGTATAADGTDTVTLATGATIPAGGCTITVSVTSAADGTYTNTIAAGALQTDLGNSAADATADVTFGPAGSCTPAQLLLDPGFEATDNSALPYTNPNWDSTSANFGSSFCDAAGCGDGGGTAAPHAGTFWAWMGGAPAGAPEDATVSQAVVIPSGDTRFLNFWLWIGAIGDGSTNMDVSVDGNVVTSFPEPVDAEAGYTQRGVDISSFADGASHTIEFSYTDANGTGSNYSVDDVTIDCTPAPATNPLPNLHPVSGAATLRRH
ncbi:MAG: hypothetical protein ABW186_09555 [Rhodanobacteraceae bacterium]